MNVTRVTAKTASSVVPKAATTASKQLEENSTSFFGKFQGHPLDALLMACETRYGAFNNSLSSRLYKLKIFGFLRFFN